MVSKLRVKKQTNDLTARILRNNRHFGVLLGTKLMRKTDARD